MADLKGRADELLRLDVETIRARMADLRKIAEAGQDAQKQLRGLRDNLNEIEAEQVRRMHQRRK